MKRAFLAGVLLLGALLAPAQAVGPAASVPAVRGLIQEGRFRLAVQAGKKAIRAAPSDPAARVALAAALLEAGDGASARVALDQAVGLGAKIPPLALMQAHVHLLGNDPVAALALLERAKIAPGEAAYAARLRLRAFGARADWSQVAQLVQQADQRGWATPGFWVDLAQINADAGNLGGAYLALDRALKARPDFGPALRLGGDLARHRYGLRASLSWYLRAAKRDPLDLDARAALAATLGDLGANRQMLAVTRDILRLDAQNPWALYCQAVMAARAGQYLLAQSLVQRMGQNLADMPGLLLLRGAIDIHLGAPDRARLSLARLVARQPANVQARQMLARASLAADDPAAVLEVLGPLAARPDADSYSLVLIARAAEAKGDRAAAIAYLKQIAPPRPGAAMPIPLTLLSATEPEDQAARALVAPLASGQAALVRERAIAARTANPGNPAVHVRLGDVEALLGNWPAARRAYRAAADLDFSEKNVLRLSRALIETGNGTEAQRLWLLFAQENPQNVSAQLMVVDVLISARQWLAAQQLLERLRVRLGNHHPTLLAALSRVSQRLGQPQHAAAYARAARIAQGR